MKAEINFILTHRMNGQVIEETFEFYIHAIKRLEELNKDFKPKATLHGVGKYVGIER